jgi:hypothetical protein
MPDDLENTRGAIRVMRRVGDDLRKKGINPMTRKPIKDSSS